VILQLVRFGGKPGTAHVQCCPKSRLSDARPRGESPEVSIILPTQGVRASLPGALRSALAQDFASFEVVVADDSIDAVGWTSQEEVRALLADPRVRVVPFHQGRGCAKAKNAGLRAARGNGCVTSTTTMNTTRTR